MTTLLDLLALLALAILAPIVALLEAVTRLLSVTLNVCNAAAERL